MAGMAGRPDLEKPTLSVALVFGFESADWIVSGIPAIASRITFGVSPSIFFADRRRLQMFPTIVIGSKDLLDLPANHLAGPSDDLRPQFFRVVLNRLYLGDGLSNRQKPAHGIGLFFQKRHAAGAAREG
jgi:hypothetical protein